MQIDSQDIDCTTLEITGQAPSRIATEGRLKKQGDEFNVKW